MTLPATAAIAGNQTRAEFMAACRREHHIGATVD
jgi:hypothetical protein